MWPYPQETSDLLIFTEAVLNGKLDFLCSDGWFQLSNWHETTNNSIEQKNQE